MRKFIVTPPIDYCITAGFFSFTTAFLVSFMTSGVFEAKDAYSGGSSGLWIKMSYGLGLILTIYSIIPKPVILLKLNWLVIILFNSIVFLKCQSTYPLAVKHGVDTIIFLSAFTLGAPLWLPILGLFLHSYSCLSNTSRKRWQENSL